MPCVPQKVRAETVCSNETGVVSWEKEEGVSSYLVQAFGPDGHKIKCNSTDTSCQLPNLHCGELYNLTVTAQDGRCDNSNAYLNLQSGKCKVWFSMSRAMMFEFVNGLALIKLYQVMFYVYHYPLTVDFMYWIIYFKNEISNTYSFFSHDYG